MRWLRTGLVWLTITLVAVLMPGIGELAENAIHLVRAGHVAHAAHHVGEEQAAPTHCHEDTDGDPEEEGCCGNLHVCGCHSSVVFLPVSAEESVTEPFWVRAPTPSFTVRQRAVDGIELAVYRPPRA